MNNMFLIGIIFFTHFTLVKISLYFKKIRERDVNMIDFEKKGSFNMHTMFVNDTNNLSNNDNKHMYGQMMLGNTNAPMLSYMLNLNKQTLTDKKSIMFYNESMLGLFINEAKVVEELLDENTIYLPEKKAKIKTKFSEVLAGRHSTRQFVYEMMDKATFSTILKYSFGISDRITTAGDVTAPTTYYPSGGGLYPIDVYLYVHHVSGISQGIYKYQPHSHTLYPLEVEHVNPSSFFVGDMLDTENMNFCVFFEYSINKNYVKYGELALSNTLIELGGISHNFDLVCHSVNFTTCPYAGFDKRKIERVLDLDGVNDHIIFTNVCGKE